jgi:hypothetical protein
MKMRVNFIIRTLYSERKKPPSALNRRRRGPENGLDHFDKEKNLLSVLGIETLLFHPIAY